MPNWCKNKIVIIGDNTSIKEILEKIGTIPVDSKKVLFETLIGTDTDSSHSWLESNLKRYGTKWDVCPGDSNIEFNDNRITMSLTTAWSPPVPFCITLAKEYGVQVEIIYSEPSNDFTGRNLINKWGDVIEEEDYDYNEGMFILNKNDFWRDRERDFLDEDENSIQDSVMTSYVKEKFPYLDEASQIRLVLLYNQFISSKIWPKDDSGE